MEIERLTLSPQANKLLFLLENLLDGLISAPATELAAALEIVDERFRHSVGTMPCGPVEFPTRATQSVQPSSNCCKIPTCCPALAGNSSGIVWMNGLCTVARVYGTPASVTRGTANMGVDSSDEGEVICPF